MTGPNPIPKPKPYHTAGLLLCLVAGAARADLTLDDCVREASGKNPTVLAAEQGVHATEAQYSGSYSGFFPQLSASAGYTETNGQVSQSVGSFVTTTNATGQPVGTYSAGLNATQSLFNGFADVGRVKQAKANLEAARAALRLAKVTASASVKTNFAQLLYAQKSVELATLLLKRQQSNLRLVTLRFEGGQENKGNQLYQAATVAQAQYQLDHAKRLILVNSKQLAALLGRPEDQPAIVVKGELGAKEPLAAETSFHKLTVLHPSHTQAFYQMVAADSNIEVVDGNWMPNLNLTGFVGRTGPEFPPNGSRWSVGAAITFPFFPGTSTIYAAQNARVLKRQAEYNVDSTDVTVYSNIEQAYGGLEDALQQLKVNQQFREAAKARSIIATEKYNTGLMTFEDWSVIETDLVTREQNLLSSQLSAMQAEATWEQAIGTGAIP